MQIIFKEILLSVHVDVTMSRKHEDARSKKRFVIKTYDVKKVLTTDSKTKSIITWFIKNENVVLSNNDRNEIVKVVMSDVRKYKEG